MAIDPNVPAIANAVTGIVQFGQQTLNGLANYGAGPANGGPNGDGLYPLKDYTGNTVWVQSPAKLAAMTTGPMAQAVVILNDVNTSKALVLNAANTVTQQLSWTVSNATASASSATTAATWAANAITQAGLTLTYRNTTQAAMNATVAANTVVASNLTASQGVLTSVQAANSAVQTAKTDTFTARDQAQSYAAAINPTAFYGAITSNVATLNNTITTGLAGKADNSALTSGLAAKAPITNPVFTSDATVNGKFVSSSATQTNGISHYLTTGGTDAKWSRNYAYANTLAFDFVNDAYTAAATWLTVGRTGYSPTAISFTGTSMTFNGSSVMAPYQGISTSLAAWRQNTLNVDGTLGDGLLNLSSNADHARMSNATATGHIAVTTGRGATRLGLHDSVLNVYVANSVSLTAGQTITWINPLSISATLASFYVQPQFNGVNLATVNDVSASTVTRAKGVVTADPGIGAGGLWVTGNKLWFADGVGAYYAWSNRDFDPATKANLSGATFSGAIQTSNIGIGTAGSMAGGGINIDISGNSFRIYERGGASRGLYADLTLAGSQSQIWHAGTFDPASKLSLTGGTMSGALNTNGPAGSTKLRGVTTNGVARWNWGASAETETGSNAGSNFNLYSYADSGAFIATPFAINRASGQASFSAIANFPNSVQIGGAASTGFYGDGGNVAIRGYASGAIYFQNAAGATTYGLWNSTGLNVYTPLNVTGNVNATGSMFVGAAGGMFGASGTNYRLIFDGATGTRVTYRSDHASAVGVNLTTNSGGLSGVLYSDGNGANFGLLNPSNGWRLRATSTDLYIGDAGYTAWHSGSLAPATTNTQQNFGVGAWKGFESATSDAFAAASGGDINALEVYSDGNRPAVMTFHRHGSYAAYFGMDSDNRWKVGGWSDGAGIKRAFWLHNQIPTGIWQNTDDGKNRFYFSPNGDSIWKSAANHGWRNASDTTVMSIDGSGNLSVTGEIATPGWIRISGTNGVFWPSYGGGWNMSDTSWMRSYSDKGIYTGGTVLAGAMQAGTITATSDARFKSRIRDLEPVAGLVPRRFVKDGRERLGYIAQEVQATLAAEAVNNEFGVNGEHYLSLEPLAVTAAVHAQLSAELAAAVARIAVLEARP